MSEQKLGKGDLPGHPFRGNQHTGGNGAGAGGIGFQYHSEQAIRASLDAHETGMAANTPARHGAAAEAHRKAFDSHKKAAAAAARAGRKRDAAWHSKRARNAYTLMTAHKDRSVGKADDADELNRLYAEDALDKGDKPGHAFRGNGSTGGIAGTPEQQADYAQAAAKAARYSSDADKASARAKQVNTRNAHIAAATTATHAQSAHHAASSAARVIGDAKAVNHHGAEASRMQTMAHHHTRRGTD